MTIATVNNVPASNDDDAIEGTVVVESTLYSDMLTVAAYKTTEQLKEMSDEQRAAWYKNVAERTTRASKKAGSAIEELAVVVAIAYAGDVPDGLGLTWQEYVSEFAPLIANGDIVIGRKFTSAFYVALHRIIGEDKKVPGARKVHAAIGEAIGASLPTFSNGLKDAREKDIPASNAAIARKAVADAQKAKEIEAKKAADKQAKEDKAKAAELAAKLEKAKATNAEVNGAQATAGEPATGEESSPLTPELGVEIARGAVLDMTPDELANAGKVMAGEVSQASTSKEATPATPAATVEEGYALVKISADDLEKVRAALAMSGIDFSVLTGAVNAG